MRVRAAISGFVLFAGAVFAENGGVIGVVLDSNGVPVVSTAVQAKNVQSSAVTKAMTSLQGRYSLDLPAGTYDVSVSVSALKP
jgi:carboxypeptidase family protein